MQLTSDMYIDQSKDWYFVTGHSRIDSTWRKVIVFAKTKKEAEAKASHWAYENGIEKVDYYRNNYKPEARELVRNGKVIK